MKTLATCILPAAFAVLMLPISCRKIMTAGQKGSISVHFADRTVYVTRAGSVPDTNDFILNVSDSRGNVLYNGFFGAAPEQIAAEPGSYTISAVSCAFDSPLYDCPQYGDTRTVVVSPGKNSEVLLECAMTNCGIQLELDWDFLSEYPSGELYLKGADGYLMFGYSEKRTAYFHPGTIALYLKSGGQERLLCTREISAREIFRMTLSAATGPGTGPASAGIDIQVDTSTVRTYSDFEVPVEGGGNDVGSAYGVAEAMNHVGEDDVWVYGYIVGGDLSSSKCSFSAPFTSRTNLVIGPKSSTAEKSSCLSVQLASGDIRNSLNLVDHPDLVGRQIFLKGQIVASYYGIPGVQKITEYKWK